MLLSALSSYTHAVLRVGATECVSNGQRMGEWMDEGQVMELLGYCNCNVFLWYHFLLLVPFIDSSNIY